MLLLLEDFKKQTQSNTHAVYLFDFTRTQVLAILANVLVFATAINASLLAVYDYVILRFLVLAALRGSTVPFW